MSHTDGLQVKTMKRCSFGRKNQKSLQPGGRVTRNHIRFCFYLELQVYFGTDIYRSGVHVLWGWLLTGRGLDFCSWVERGKKQRVKSLVTACSRQWLNWVQTSTLMSAVVTGRLELWLVVFSLKMFQVLAAITNNVTNPWRYFIYFIVFEER